ncbi:MAG: SDR family NAD(P)-dependent oxidoreductase [Phycisphaerae bacterium]|nr:SDR family NAD(P)-dependent oxidoreductase [Phycisphaerae bacterium]
MKNHAGIVLGAGKGLGRTICHRLNGKFKCLILAGRSRENLEVTLSELQKQAANPNAELVIRQVDLTDHDSIATFVESLKDVEFLLMLPNDAWIESIEVRPCN